MHDAPDAPPDLHVRADVKRHAPDAHVRLRAVRTYVPGDRPHVLVEVEDQWRRGQLCQWSLDPAGHWWAHVAWQEAPGVTWTDTFPAQRVWEDHESAHPWS